MELDYHFRGALTREEIIHILLDFLDKADAFSETKLTIITGKGMVIRPIVMQELKKHTRVESFSFADYWNGQDGAIELTLKDKA